MSTSEDTPDAGIKQRVPPGQRLVTKFPVLHVGGIPKFDVAKWDFRVFGEVQKEIRLSYAEFMALPHTTIKTDIHCVTGWSMLDTEWEGIRLTDLLKLVEMTPQAAFVTQHCEGSYTTNTPLRALLDDDVLLAFGFNGAGLAPEHGGPLRTLVPKLYLWKSGKWVRGIEFMQKDRLGFWEQRGYHNGADPWREERYSF
jgi:DMSO/TMAO reductase YedYZ molybdopterin-dependent catalytic subunit